MPKKEELLITGDKLLFSDFKTEKEMEDWFWHNKESCFFALTGKKLKKLQRQYIFSRVKTSETMNAYSSGRVDFLATDELNEFWLIELKNPKLNSDLISGLVQLFYYQELLDKFEHKKAKMLLVSSKFDGFAGSFLQKFKEVSFSILTKNGVSNFISYEGEK